MKIIIIGAGLTGTELAKKLISEKNDVVIIDNDEETVRHVSNKLDCMVIHADGGTADVEASDEEILIVLSDKGPGIPDVELAMQAGYSTAKDHIRNLGFGAGMGFPNMKKYTDEMRIDTVVGQGTTITMKVKI